MVVGMREPITARNIVVIISIIILLMFSSGGNITFHLLVTYESVTARIEIPDLTIPSYTEFNRADNDTESDEQGGSWYQTSDADFNPSSASNVSISGTGADARLILSNNSIDGTYISSNISLLDDMQWSVFSVRKDEPVNTSLNVSFFDPATNMTILGYDNLTGSHLDISYLNDAGITAFRLVGYFSGDENNTPSLENWGVEWIANNSWRDSFTGDSMIVPPANISLNGSATPGGYNISTSLYSIEIQLPEGHIWDTFRCNRTVPAETFLNISIHDAVSREKLLYSNSSTENLTMDMSVIDPILHPSIYLQAYFGSNMTEIPILHHWGLNWSPIISPVLVEEIDALEILEDTPADNILDISAYFYDPYSSFGPTNYTLFSGNNSDNITVELNGTNISLTHLAENWTGVRSLHVNCTNVFNLTTRSNEFTITVRNLNDRPVWTSHPPDIVMPENTIHTSNYSLEDFVYDADGDDLEFFITTFNINVTAELDDNHSVVIIPSTNYSGKGVLNLTVSETSGDRLSANIYVNFSVEAVNDVPEATLRFPANGSILTSFDTTLIWKVRDLDSQLKDIRFDLYFSTNRTPGLNRSGIKGTSWILEGLTGGTTYYWYVIPSDAKTGGRCTSGTWDFSINTSKIIPHVVLASPLDGFFFNVTGIELKWSLSENIVEDIRFYVFYGISSMNLELLWELDMFEFHLDIPRENNTFYWYVLPASGRIMGECSGGLWEFSYVKDFEPIFSVSSTLDISNMTLGTGENRTFNLTIENTGNNPMLVDIEIEGSLAQYVKPLNTVHLDMGTGVTLPITIRADDKILSNEYQLTILIKHPGGTFESNISVTVVRDDDGTKSTERADGSSDVDWFWLIMDIIAAAVLIIGIILVIRKQKKKPLVIHEEKGEEDGAEQKGGNVYFVGMSKDGIGDDQRIPGILEDHFDTMLPSGNGQSEQVSGIRPPKWLSGSEKNHLEERDFRADEETEEEPSYIHDPHMVEAEYEEEHDGIVDIPEDISSWQDPEEEVTPRPPRWLKREGKKAREEKIISTRMEKEKRGALEVEQGGSHAVYEEPVEDNSEPESISSGYDFLSPAHFFSDDDDTDE